MKIMPLNFVFYLCLLFSSQMRAQTQLPISLQPYAHNLQPTVVNGLRQLGYAVPKQSRKQLPSTRLAERSNALRLDSTKTFYQYNVPIPGDSSPLYRTHFTYPAPAQKHEEEAVFENGAWQVISRAVSTYDQSDRLIKVDAVVLDPVQQTFVPDSKLEVFPHGNSETLFDSMFVWQWNTDQNEWLLLIANRNYYDAQDHILEAYSIFNAFGQWLDLKEVYTYDSNGDNVQTATFVLIDGIEYPAGVTETAYLNHLAIQSTQFILDENGMTIPESRTEFSYTPFSQVALATTYQWLGNWILSEENHYSYDAQQRLTALENRYFPSNAPELRDKQVYQYQQDDYLAFEDAYFWDETNGFWLDERKHYYYSGGASSVHQPATASLPLVIYPNPTHGLATLQLDVPANVDLYNTLGQRLSTRQVQPNESLQLEHLPAGIYYIQARTELGIFTGQIVKSE